MKKPKHQNKKDQEFGINPGNPADHGLDHNVSRGPEKDLEDTFIQAQEAGGNRGVDNEDDTSALESDEENPNGK